MKKASFYNPLREIIYKPSLCACSDKAMREIVNMVPFKFHIPFRGNPLCPWSRLSGVKGFWSRIY